MSPQCAKASTELMAKRFLLPEDAQKRQSVRDNTA